MAGPHPDVAAARVAVRESLAPFGPGTRVLVACSGGADSLALAATTAFLAPRLGLAAGSVTVDHRLRAGSTAEAHAVAGRCRELGLDPALVVTARAGDGGGPEGAARAARYAALRDAAAGFASTGQRDGGARPPESATASGRRPVLVLLGHTMDDQAETVLLGLARGSGPRSIAGMPPRAPLDDRGAVELVRPFLGLRRAQTEQICRELGLDWVRDPTNAADGPWRAADGSPLRRAALRDRALPALMDALGPGVVPALARTAAQLRRDEDYLHGAALELLARARQAGATKPSTSGESAGAGPPDRPGAPRADGGEVVEVLDVATLAGAHAALRTRALVAAVLEAGATPGDLTAVHARELDRLVTDYHGQGPVPVPGGLVVTRGYGRLVVHLPRPAGGP